MGKLKNMAYDKAEENIDNSIEKIIKENFVFKLYINNKKFSYIKKSLKFSYKIKKNFSYIIKNFFYNNNKKKI